MAQARVLTRFSASTGLSFEPFGKGILVWGSDSPVKLLLSTLSSVEENRMRSAGVLSPLRYFQLLSKLL